MPRLAKERFEQLVHEHHGPVYRAALRVSGDEATAADLAQEVFLRVLEGKEHVDAARSERATLCWLAARLAANARRSRRRRHDHEENAMRTRPESHDRCDPAALSADADLRRAVHEHVQALPHDLRVPLLMRCQDELTLAAIGTALRVPVSTVHDRIESALQRLRAGLGRRAQALSAVALPQLVGDEVAPPVPAGLEASLLALGNRIAPVVASAGHRAMVAVLALAGAVGVAFAANALRGGGSPSSAAVAAVAPEQPQDPPRPAAPPPPARERVDAAGTGAAEVRAPAVPAVLATLHGTVRDSEAWPVAFATVQVVAGGGYKPFELGEPTTTDARGAFRVDVKPTFLPTRLVRLIVRENGRELLTTGDLVVPRAADAPPLELVLPAAVGTATGRYELTVAVQDEVGVPLPGVAVRLCGPEATRPDGGAVEVSAKSGGDGHAVLAGRGLGKKWLFVDGRPLHRRSVHVPFEVKSAGQHRTTATLAQGGELLARVTTIDDQELDWCNASLEDERTGLQHDSEGGPGRMLRFRGLGDGPFTLRAHGGFDNFRVAWSPACRTGLTSGDMVRLRLKPRTELRDVGDHMAELHGALFDAATGEPLSFGPFEVDLMPAFAGDSTLPFDRVEPPGPGQRGAEVETFTGFHHVGLAPGRWTIVVDLPGYALAAAEFELRAGEMKTDVRVELLRPATVRGRVVDAAGQPVAGALVFAVGIGALADAHLQAWRSHRRRDEQVTARSPSFTPLVCLCDGDGTFALGRVPPGVLLRLAAGHDDSGFGVRSLPVVGSGQTIVHQDVRLEPR